MKTELISTIDDIVKYGLQPNLNVENNEIEIEEKLIKIYLMQFGVSVLFDEKDYPDFDRSIPDLTKNVKSNFPNFGYYKVILDINNLSEWNDVGTGDAIDDLHDIIIDLLEVKWRIENNSLENGLWYLKFIFKNHTQQHIIDLLNYMKQKNSNCHGSSVG